MVQKNKNFVFKIFFCGLLVFGFVGFLVRLPIVSAATTEFYVDPDYTGLNGTADGSAAKPWAALGNGSGTQWTTINNALAGGSATVYFSARETSLDVPEEITKQVLIYRTDTSANQLTLDGESKYNSDDSTPQWSSYSGNSKTRIKITGQSLSIGTEYGNTGPMNYTTIRGFEATGATGRVTFAGSHVVVEDMWIHDITSTGATLQFGTAVNSSCQEVWGRLTDITIKNNFIDNGLGEGIYIAGNYQTVAAGGCPSYGNTHSDILIENNTINNSGFNGGQGDGIDLKAGLLNVTVRNNVIHNMHANYPAGITSDGIFSSAVNTGPDNISGNYIIENNLIYSGENHGMKLSNQNGTIIRNNVVYNNVGVGISFTGSGNNLPNNTNVEIYNNTLYGNAGGGLSFGYTNNGTAKNNLAFNNGSGAQSSAFGSSTNLVSNYNLYAPHGSSGGGLTDGFNSIILTSFSGIVVDAQNADFHLIDGSPAIDKGTSISSVTLDRDNISRPQGSAWDIGAFEYNSGGSPPPPPPPPPPSPFPQPSPTPTPTPSPSPSPSPSPTPSPSGGGGSPTPPPSPSPLLGDLNQDKIVNSLDWSIMNSHWFSSDPVSDLNHDGIVNAIDFSLLNANWFKTVP